MDNYHVKTLVAGLALVLTEPVYAASQTDISRLISKIETQGSCSRIHVPEDKGRECLLFLHDVSLEGYTYDLVSLGYFVGDHGTRHVDITLLKFDRGIQMHAIYDGENGPLDGKPDLAFKHHFEEKEMDDDETGFTQFLNRYKRNLVPADVASTRLFDAVVRKNLDNKK